MRPVLPRMRPATAVLCALLLAAGVAGVLRTVRGESDFDGFQRAAAYLWTHGEVSTAKDVRRYLPTFQVLLLPFGAMPLVLASLLWTALDLAALAALPRAFAALTGIAPARQLAAFWVAAPLLADNLILGQSAPILIWLAVSALARVRAGRAASGGARLGLAALLKILPATLVVVPLLLGRRARAGAFVLGVLVALWLGAWTTVLALGPERAVRETQRWSEEAGEGQSPWALVESGRSLRFNNQGLAVTLARTFGELSPEQEDAARGALRLATFPLPAIWTVWGLVAAGLAALASVVARRARSLAPADPAEGRAWLALLAVAVALMLALSPVVWTHYVAWMLPALVVLVDRPRLQLVFGVVLAAALLSETARALGVHLVGLIVLCVLAGLTVVSRGAASDVEGGRPATPLPSRADL
ncbi:MAG: DUF2029 domain-containing protein [Planctomycetes bacterium]|nr:DUF2029 domain-containing protein [Planctomycetota bacterium]